MAFDASARDGFTPEAKSSRSTEPLDGRESVVRNRPGKLTEIIANAMQLKANAGVVFNGGSVRLTMCCTDRYRSTIIRVLPFGGKC